MAAYKPYTSNPGTVGFRYLANENDTIDPQGNRKLRLLNIMPNPGGTIMPPYILCKQNCIYELLEGSGKGWPYDSNASFDSVTAALLKGFYFYHTKYRDYQHTFRSPMAQAHDNGNTKGTVKYVDITNNGLFLVPNVAGENTLGIKDRFYIGDLEYILYSDIPCKVIKTVQIHNWRLAAK